MNKLSYLGIVICLALIVMSALSWAAEFTDGLVVYLPFDEGAGGTTKDASGNKNDGKLEGKIKWANGKFGKVLQFNGEASASWVMVKSNKQLNVDSFTFMA